MPSSHQQIFTWYDQTMWVVFYDDVFFTPLTLRFFAIECLRASEDFALALPDILKEYPQYSKAALGSAMTGLSVAYGVSKFIMGSVSDRSNPRWFMSLGLLLTSAVTFAFGSIPAIYGLTREPYIVFTANVFALMGLRQLYFLLGDMLNRLVYLSQGLAFILLFIGVKLILHALHENELPFINGGEGLHVPEIPTLWSLGVIILTLFITMIASLIKTRVASESG